MSRPHSSSRRGPPEPDAPQAEEAEHELLGAVLKGEPFERIRSEFDLRDFYTEFHRRVFSAMGAVHERGVEIDVTTIFEEFQRRGLPEKMSDIQALTNGIPDGQLPNIDSLIRTIKRKSNLRLLATRGSALHNAALLEIDDPEVLAARLRQDLDAMQAAPDTAAEEEEQATADAFPEIAWRGIFADYRAAMKGSTEASDVAHFITFWAAAAVIAGRSVYMDGGDIVYPNVYLAFFGPSGDKKTTAERRIFRCDLFEHHPLVKVVRGVGTTEGLADAIGGAETGIYLFFWEEFVAFLSKARWDKSTLFEFFAQIFDCPDEYDTPYRKNAVHLDRPTPTVLTATTVEWFWKQARAEDFYGGFMNRYLFFTGKKKPPLPNPANVNGEIIHKIKEHLKTVASNPPQRAEWTPAAKKIFTSFYLQFEGQQRSGLLAEAVKRAHVYVRKLAMLYAWLEQTLPHIDADQVSAAIAVVSHSMGDVERLIDLQNAQSKPAGDLEQKFLKWVGNRPGETLRKFHQRMWKYCGDSETFNRIFKSLCIAGQLELREGRVYLCIR